MSALLIHFVHQFQNHYKDLMRENADKIDFTQKVQLNCIELKACIWDVLQ